MLKVVNQYYNYYYYKLLFKINVGVEQTRTKIHHSCDMWVWFYITSW